MLTGRMLELMVSKFAEEKAVRCMQSIRIVRDTSNSENCRVCCEGFPNINTLSSHLDAAHSRVGQSVDQTWLSWPTNQHVKHPARWSVSTELHYGSCHKSLLYSPTVLAASVPDPIGFTGMRLICDGLKYLHNMFTTRLLHICDVMRNELTQLIGVGTSEQVLVINASAST